MKNIKIALSTFLPFFALMLFCLNVNAQPFNSQATHVFPAHQVVNPCNGDVVDFPDGVIHVMTHGVIRNNGTMNFHAHVNANLHGETADGVTYICNINDNYHWTQSSGSETEAFNQHLISNGGGSNFWFNGTINIHVNANGVVTVDVPPTGTASCSGN